MKKPIAWSLALSILFSSAPTWAQPRAQSAQPGTRGPSGRGPDGRGPRGGMRGMRGPKMRLERTWRGIGQLEGTNAVSKDQARRLAALVRPWSSKPTMSEADATALTTRINAILTTSQKSALESRGPGGRDGRGRDGRGFGGPPGGEGREGGRRGDRPGGPNGPDGPGGFGGRGPGGPGGSPGGFDRSKMEAMRTQMDSLRKTSNPFYPPSKSPAAKKLPDFMREGMTRRYEESRATLSALARRAG